MESVHLWRSQATRRQEPINGETPNPRKILGSGNLFHPSCMFDVEKFAEFNYFSNPSNSGGYINQSNQSFISGNIQHLQGTYMKSKKKRKTYKHIACIKLILRVVLLEGRVHGRLEIMLVVNRTLFFVVSSFRVLIKFLYDWGRFHLSQLLQAMPVDAKMATFVWLSIKLISTFA